MRRSEPYEIDLAAVNLTEIERSPCVCDNRYRAFAYTAGLHTLAVLCVFTPLLCYGYVGLVQGRVQGHPVPRGCLLRASRVLTACWPRAASRVWRGLVPRLVLTELTVLTTRWRRADRAWVMRRVSKIWWSLLPGRFVLTEGWPHADRRMAGRELAVR